MSASCHTLHLPAHSTPRVSPHSTPHCSPAGCAVLDALHHWAAGVVAERVLALACEAACSGARRSKQAQSPRRLLRQVPSCRARRCCLLFHQPAIFRRLQATQYLVRSPTDPPSPASQGQTPAHRPPCHGPPPTIDVQAVEEERVTLARLDCHALAAALCIGCLSQRPDTRMVTGCEPHHPAVSKHMAASPGNPSRAEPPATLPWALQTSLSGRLPSAPEQCGCLCAAWSATNPAQGNESKAPARRTCVGRLPLRLLVQPPASGKAGFASFFHICQVCSTRAGTISTQN